MASDLPRGTVSLAALLAGIALSLLLVGVPIMLQDVANLEMRVIAQRQVYLDQTNNAWYLNYFFIIQKTCLTLLGCLRKHILDEGEKTRQEHAMVRQRRQSCNFK